MIVLLTGASGFLGRRLAAALLARGHRVVAAGRAPVAAGPHAFVPADFRTDHRPEDWRPRLAGVDVVVNAVGILRERIEGDFEAIHARAPRALFAACAAAGVRRVIQISALGADGDAASAYHLSKKDADDFLLSLPLAATVVQPSLVFGPGGTSARLFARLASLPLIPLPGAGEQCVQPIHIDDLVDAVLALVELPAPPARIALVGPQPLPLREFIARLRHAMGLAPGRFVPVPLPLVASTARIAAHLPGSLLEPETLGMLERGSCADAAPLARLLGRPPRGVEQFVPAAEAATLRAQAKLGWLLPLLRFAVALVWIVTGVLSFGLYPVEDSYALLARVGATGWIAPLLLYGAAALDLAIGIAILVLPRRRLLWLAQIAVIVLYTALISWRLPEFWLHPYGPVLKNLPLLTAIWLLYEAEDEWTT